MTIEVFYLTAQLNRWLNARVARHLEAQAARFDPTKGAIGMAGPTALTARGIERPGISAAGAGCRGTPDCIHDIAAGERHSTRQTVRA